MIIHEYSLCIKPEKCEFSVPSTSFSLTNHHDGPLCAPQKTCANTEQRSGKDYEAPVLCVIVAQKGGGIDAISKASNGERRARTEVVEKRSGGESKDSKGRVERCVGARINA